MIFNIGYDNTESESKFYITYKYKKYGQFLSNILKTPTVNKQLEVEFNTTKSPFSIKYALNFKNIFFYKFPSSLWSLDMEIFSKKKIVRMVNFDVLPGFKFSCSSNSPTFPLTFNIKHGRYQAARDQIFERYDFQKIIPSLLPYTSSSFSVVHENFKELNIYKDRKNPMFIYRGKIGLNRIHNFEDNIKLSAKLKSLFTVKVFDKFDVNISNESVVQKSFLLKTGEEDSHHVLSGFDCFSKILGMNIVSDESSHILNPGTTFSARNQLTLRLSNIAMLKDSDLAKVIEPFITVESIFLPYFNQTREQFLLSDFFRFVLSFGISLKIADTAYLDFMLYTKGFNVPVKQESINRFRLQFDFSTSL